MSKKNLQNKNSSRKILLLGFLSVLILGLAGVYLIRQNTDLSEVLGTSATYQGVKPRPGYIEPDFVACPAGSQEVGRFEGFLRQDAYPRTHSYSFSIDYEAIINIQGLVKEGHPELDCTGTELGHCQWQYLEEFSMQIEGETIGQYLDKGAVDEWFTVSNWKTSAALPAGNYQAVTTHSHINNAPTAESVDYKLTACAEEVIAAPEPPEEGVSVEPDTEANSTPEEEVASESDVELDQVPEEDSASEPVSDESGFDSIGGSTNPTTPESTQQDGAKVANLPVPAPNSIQTPSGLPSTAGNELSASSETDSNINVPLPVTGGHSTYIAFSALVSSLVLIFAGSFLLAREYLYQINK